MSKIKVKKKKEKWIIANIISNSDDLKFCKLCGEPLFNSKAYVKLSEEINKEYAHIKCMRQATTDNRTSNKDCYNANCYSNDNQNNKCKQGIAICNVWKSSPS